MNFRALSRWDKLYKIAFKATFVLVCKYILLSKVVGFFLICSKGFRLGQKQQYRKKHLFNIATVFSTYVYGYDVVINVLI